MIKKNEILDTLKKLINESIIFEELDLKAFKWNIDQNLEYHTARHDGNLTKNSDTELIFYTLIDKFIEDVHKKTDIKDGKMSLHRAISLETIDKLNPNIGIYWSFDKDNTCVFDDEGFNHENNDRENYKTFEFNSEISLTDINWKETFDIYIIQEFGESEIRLNNDAIFHNLIYKESGKDDYNKIKNINLNSKKTKRNRKLKN